MLDTVISQDLQQNKTSNMHVRGQRFLDPQRPTCIRPLYSSKHLTHYLTKMMLCGYQLPPVNSAFSSQLLFP